MLIDAMLLHFLTGFWGLIVYVYDAQLVHSNGVWCPKSGSGNVVIVRMGVCGGYLVTLALSLHLEKCRSN